MGFLFTKPAPAPAAAAAAPVPTGANLTKEQFFNTQYKPSIGGDAGLLSFYPSGGRASGQIDGTPKAPDYNQFIAGTSTYTHRAGGKTYSFSAKDPNAMIGGFNAAYDKYLADEEYKTAAATEARRLDAIYTQQAGELNAAAGQVRAGTVGLSGALNALSGSRNYGASNLGTKLNFQVSDDQILNDYNESKLNSLQSVLSRGNTQIVGINDKIVATNSLLSNLRANDPRRAPLEASLKTLNEDIRSVNDAISSSQSQITNYKPITSADLAGKKEITSFREYLKLPEERASEQLKQIDPESYQTSVILGQKYRELATAPIGQTQNAQTEAFRSELEKAYKDYSISGTGKTLDEQTEAYRAQLQKQIQDYSMSQIGATTTPETEALRRQIEGEATSQLALGSALGAQEQRQYQQASRAAQTARGNIFGVAPAVEEAVTTGAAGEQRRLARYGAANQFLASGQTTSDALAKDVALRDALQQARYQTGGAMLASGQTTSDALARDVALRNSIQLSKLGAGSQFLSSGQTSSDALQRDVALRDALLQTRLGSASGFLSSGPTIYNLANQRTAQQQNAMQQYIQANQSLPGSFGQGASTASNFYQATDPNAPLALQQAAVSLYNGLLGYQASTYGNMLQAQNQQQSGASQFAQIAGGIGNIASPISGGFKSYTLGGAK